MTQKEKILLIRIFNNMHQYVNYQQLDKLDHVTPDTTLKEFLENLNKHRKEIKKDEH